MRLKHTLFGVLLVNVFGGVMAENDTSGSLLEPIHQPMVKRMLADGKLLTERTERYRLPPSVSSIDGVINQMFPTDFSIDDSVSYVANAHFKSNLSFPATLASLSGENLWGVEQSSIEKGSTITAQYRYTDPDSNECKVKLVHKWGVLSATVTQVQAANSTLQCNTSLITNSSKAKYSLAIIGDMLATMSVSYNEEPPVNTQATSANIVVQARLTNNGSAVTLHASPDSVTTTDPDSTASTVTSVSQADTSVSPTVQSCSGVTLQTGESCNVQLTFDPGNSNSGDVTWKLSITNSNSDVIFNTPVTNWHIST